VGYIDLIPDVFRLTMPDLATGKSYHTQKFNVGNKQCIGVTIKASQALSVAVAYGIATDTAAAAGVDIAASLPYKTSATSFASNTSTEGGTYHEIAVPPHARQAQLVISNASGSTVSGAVIDAALRVVAYPAASGSGSSGNFCRAGNGTTNQTIPANTTTTIVFGTLLDGAGLLASNKITVNKDGRWLLIAKALIGKDGTAGQVSISLISNGSIQLSASVKSFSASEVLSLITTDVVTLAANDEITVTTSSVTGHTVYSDAAGYAKSTCLTAQYLGD